MPKRIKATATVRLLVTVDLSQGWGEDCMVSQVWDQSSKQARIAVGEAVKKIHDMRLVSADVISVTAIASQEE